MRKSTPVKVRQERIPLSQFEVSSINQCIEFEEKVLRNVSGLTPDKVERIESRIKLLQKRLDQGYYLRESW
jgi:hypothetical protein